MLAGIIYDNCEPLPALSEFHAVVDLMLDSDDENIKSTLEEVLMLTKMIHGDEIKERMDELARVRQIKKRDEDMILDNHKSTMRVQLAQVQSLFVQFIICVNYNKLGKLLSGLKMATMNPEAELKNQMMKALDNIGDQISEMK